MLTWRNMVLCSTGIENLKYEERASCAKSFDEYMYINSYASQAIFYIAFKGNSRDHFKISHTFHVYDSFPNTAMCPLLRHYTALDRLPIPMLNPPFLSAPLHKALLGKSRKHIVLNMDYGDFCVRNTNNTRCIIHINVA